MRLIIASLFGCLAGAMPLQAQPYPGKPITMVVGFGKGTTAEIIGVVVAEVLSKNVDQPVKVELKPGEGSGIAMELVEKAAPDGTTIGLITQGTHVFNLSLYTTLRYDPKKIMPVTPIAAVTNVMTVHPSNPAQTPLGAVVAAMTGSDITHVPHLISVDGIKRIVSGEMTMGFFNIPAVIDEIKTGKLKALAVTSLAPSPHLPGLPTLDASGVKGYDMVTWFGFGVPAGTPPEIVLRLREEVARAAADPPVQAGPKEAPHNPIAQMQPAEFVKLIDADLAKWTPIIKAASSGTQ